MQNNERKSDEAASRAEKWKNRINSWKESGLSQAEYCRQNDLTQNAFMYWKRKLSEESHEEFVELSGNFAPAKKENLIEVSLDDDLRLRLNFNLNLARILERR